MGGFDYKYGLWMLESETALIRMNDTTYQRHLKAHLQRLGIDTRTYLELCAYTDQVLTRRIEAARQLATPDYWLNCHDPDVYILHKPPWVLLDRR